MSTPGDSTLSQRVALFGLMIGLLSLGGFTVRLVLHAVLGNPGTVWSLAWGAHLVAALLPLTLWTILRSRRCTRRQIEALEVVALWGTALAYQKVGSHLAPEARPDYAVVLAMNVVFIARAAYVPSTAGRTLWLTGLVGLPMVVLFYRDFSLLAAAGVIPGHAPVTRTLNAGIWWTIVTILATLISDTIYGLRREVSRVRRLGQYTLEERIAEGGMGEVYRARHGLLRRPTAVKLIRRERVGEQALSRFEQEARLTASLTHPNTVTIFDYGRTEDGVFYYAMELLEGPDLQTVIDATGPLHVGRACRILAQVASALAEAHEAGLIHRDVKPGNVLLVERGGTPDVAKVVDFGLVKELGGGATVAEEGTIVGTPLYLSPEAIADRDGVDARSDLYALGALAYVVLTGRPVFRGDTVMHIYTQHLESAPEPPSAHLDTPLPPILERLILECLEKSPIHRPQSAQEVRVRLLAAAEEAPPWDEHDAQAWWRRHGPELTRQRERADSLPRPITVARRESLRGP
ncbi:MAG: serine/threonine-protein kinase [Sandaracinaceae bacterium]